MSATASVQTINLVREPINDDYEWIQYNNELRVIRSVHDDMYQIQSIIEACHSTKQARHWFNNASTKELLRSFDRHHASGRILPVTKPYDYRNNMSNGLRGYYIHRLLVNSVAMWASPTYSVKVLLMLDEIATQERHEMQQVINEQQPRMVPTGTERDYTYLIWIEDHPHDNNMSILHLVRCNNKNAKRVANQHKGQIWFCLPNLPIVMTVNHQIKALLRNEFTNPLECYTYYNNVYIYKSLLQQARNVICNYFVEYGHM